MKACIVLAVLLASCAHTTNVADRFDSVDQQLSGLREQLHIQQQMITELRKLLADQH